MQSQFTKDIVREVDNNLMPRAATPILHISQPTSNGCGACSHLPAGLTSCTVAAYRRCPQPLLRGPQAPMARALKALGQVLDANSGQNLLAAQLVSSLVLDDSSAELTLTVSSHCGGGRALAESSFQALRGVLPDTDIYVMHAPAGAGANAT